MSSPSSRKSRFILLSVYDHAPRIFLSHTVVLTRFLSVISWNRLTTAASLVPRKPVPWGLVLPFHSPGTRATPMPSVMARVCCRPRKRVPLHSSQEVTNPTTKPHSGSTHTPLGRTKLRPSGPQCLILSNSRNHTHLGRSTFRSRLSKPKGIPPSTEANMFVRSSPHFQFLTNMATLNSTRRIIIRPRCL